MSLSKLVIPRRLSSLPVVYRLSINRYQSTVPLKQTIENNKNNVRPFEEIPGPKEFPYIGSAHRYIMNGGFRKFHKVNQKLFEEFGPIFKVSLFGQTLVYVLDPDDTQTVFRSEGRYPKRLAVESLKKVYDEKHITSIFLSDGAEWKHLRKAVQSKMMRPKELYDSIDGFNGVVDDALESIRRARGTGKSEGEVPNLEDELTTWATESIGTLVFDSRIGLYNEVPNQDAQEFIKAVRILFESLHHLELSGEKIFYEKFDTPSLVKLRKSMDDLRRIGQKKVDAKMEELKNDLKNPEKLLEAQAVPLLSYLLAKQELTKKEIIDNAIDMFFSGVDTTSNMLIWGLYRLANHQDVQKRVYQEMMSVIGKDGYLTGKDMGKIPYLKAFLKEMLRLDGIAPGNARILDQDITLKGYNITAGTPIVMEIYTTNRSEKYIKDGKEFKPERWLKDAEDKLHPFISLPFGFGPRMCIGKRAAELEVILFLSKVVQKFKLEYNHEPVEKKTDMFLKADRNIHINFIDRP